VSGFKKYRAQPQITQIKFSQITLCYLCLIRVICGKNKYGHPGFMLFVFA